MITSETGPTTNAEVVRRITPGIPCRYQPEPFARHPTYRDVPVRTIKIPALGGLFVRILGSLAHKFVFM